MTPAESKSQFERFVSDAGCSCTIETLDVAEAIRLMLAHYRQVRAADCPLDEDGDMLLFQ